MSAAPAVVEIQIADEPDAWRAAGFTVTTPPSGGDGLVQVGAIAIRLIGRADHHRVRGWSWSDLLGDGPLDGLATTAAAPSADPPADHANGSTILDHIVVVSPNLDRTISSFTARGLDVRRVRDTEQYGAPFRQVFFRGGQTIIELIGPVDPEPGDDRPAHFYGLAFTVGDLDELPTLLGNGVGSIKEAVQPGRRIATLRHRDYDISVPIAFMSV